MGRVGEEEGAHVFEDRWEQCVHCLTSLAEYLNKNDEVSVNR